MAENSIYYELRGDFESLKETVESIEAKVNRVDEKMDDFIEVSVVNGYGKMWKRSRGDFEQELYDDIKTLKKDKEMRDRIAAELKQGQIDEAQATTKNRDDVKFYLLLFGGIYTLAQTALLIKVFFF